MLFVIIIVCYHYLLSYLSSVLSSLRIYHVKIKVKTFSPLKRDLLFFCKKVRYILRPYVYLRVQYLMLIVKTNIRRQPTELVQHFAYSGELTSSQGRY